MTLATPFDFGYRGSWLSEEPARQRYAGASGILAALPAAVALPESTPDLAALLRWARETGVPLVPRAAATGMPGGNVGPGLALEMMPGFSAPPEIDPVERRASVQPGITLARLNEAAASAGLHFPVDPSSAPRCTLGGMIANNSAGAHSVRHGATRAWVHSLDLLLDDGTPLTLTRGVPTPEPLRTRLRPFQGELESERATILAAWPRVRKNSSGYALREFLLSGDALDLFVGSEGTLGLITGATLALAPRPRTAGLLLVEFDDLDATAAAIQHLIPLLPDTCEYLDRTFLDLVRGGEEATRYDLPEALEAILLLEVSGESEEEVERRMHELEAGVRPFALRAIAATDPEHAHALWAIRHAASPIIAREAGRRISMQFIEDSVVPLEALPDYVRELRAILAAHQLPAVIFGHAGDGNLHVNPLVDPTDPSWRTTIEEVLRLVVALVRRLGGTLAGEHGDGRLRAPFLEQIWGADCFRLFTRLKETLDPHGILNPGVIVPLPGQQPFAFLREYPER